MRSSTDENPVAKLVHPPRGATGSQTASTLPASMRQIRAAPLANGKPVSSGTYTRRRADRNRSRYSSAGTIVPIGGPEGKPPRHELGPEVGDRRDPTVDVDQQQVVRRSVGDQHVPTRQQREPVGFDSDGFGGWSRSSSSGCVTW